jgi:hypothetical protein
MLYGAGIMRRIRFAFRSLAKAPLLSLVVVLSLGLGIGVNTAIFSLLHQVVLSALPIRHPEQIVIRFIDILQQQVPAA